MNKLSYQVHIFVMAFSVLFLTQPMHDPDLGWQLAGGKWITDNFFYLLDNHNFSIAAIVPRADFINFKQEYWQNYHWLLQIVMYWVFSTFDYTGLVVLFYTIFAATCLLILRIGLHIKSNNSALSPIPFLIIILGSLVLLLRVSGLRAQTVSFLVLAYVVLKLIQPQKKYEFLVLFLLCCMLVNVHVYWVFIPVTYFFYRVMPCWFDRGFSKQLAKEFFYLSFISLAGLVSPYGIFSVADPFQNYRLLVEFALTDSYFKANISDLAGGLYGWSIATLIILAYLILFVRNFNFTRVNSTAGCHLAALFALYLAIAAVKYSGILAIFGLVSVLLITPNLRFNFSPKLLKALIATCIFLFFVKVLFHYQDFSSWNKKITEKLPIEACQTLATYNLDPNYNYKILTEFAYGGSCYWGLFQSGITNFQVSTDSRTQWVSVDDFKDYQTIYFLKPGWLALLQNWNPDFILASSRTPLGNILPYLKNDWTQVYFDNLFAIYQKNVSAQTN